MENPKAHPTLQTARLILRLPSEHDVPALIRYYRENAERFAPTSPARPAGYHDEASWRSRIGEYRSEFERDQSLRFFLFDSATDRKVLGAVSFTNFIRGPLQGCNLGYALCGSCEGQGLMFEALTPAIRYVFDELSMHRIMAGHLPENERSARLLKRLGFEIEGLAKEFLMINGQWRDHVMTALVNPGWKS